MALEMDDLIENHYPLNECSVFVLGVYFSVSSLSPLFSIFHMHTFRCVQPKVEENDEGKKKHQCCIRIFRSETNKHLMVYVFTFRLIWSNEEIKKSFKRPILRCRLKELGKV